jgi:hypothetical protein
VAVLVSHVQHGHAQSKHERHGDVAHLALAQALQAEADKEHLAEDLSNTCAGDHMLCIVRWQCSLIKPVEIGYAHASQI